MAGNKNFEKREEKQFWAFVEKAAREVDGWPEWMKGGSSSESPKKTTGRQNPGTEPKQGLTAKRRT